MRRRYFQDRANLAALTLIGSLLLAPIQKSEPQPKPNEYQVKAAFLYNFGRFVDWPSDSVAGEDHSFDICVIGRDPFGRAIDDAIAGGSIDGKPVAAKRILKPQDALNCRILFISSSEESRLKTILDAVDKSSILTVSDLPQFVQKGGMIQFVLTDNKIRFEVDLASAEKAHLTLSSELLKIATAVRRRPSGGN